MARRILPAIFDPAEEHGADVTDGNGVVVELVRLAEDDGVNDENAPGFGCRPGGDAQNGLVRWPGARFRKRGHCGAPFRARIL